MANFNPITKPLLNVSGPVDTRSVARQQDFYSEDNTSGFNAYEGLTFYDKGEKSLKYVTKVETDEDGMTSIKGINSILDSSNEEGLRKLIAETSTGLTQLVEDTETKIGTRITESIEGVNTQISNLQKDVDGVKEAVNDETIEKIGQADKYAIGLCSEEQGVSADLKNANCDGLMSAA